jgi:hypothetical protein
MWFLPSCDARKQGTVSSSKQTRQWAQHMSNDARLSAALVVLIATCARASTATLQGPTTSISCPYSSFTVTAGGALNVSCSSNPVAPAPAPTPAPTPAPSPAPGTCPALPTGYTTVVEPNGVTGQFLFENPGSYDRVQNDAGKIVVYEFNSGSTPFSFKSVQADNNSSFARKDVSVSVCPGDFSTTLADCVSFDRFSSTVTMTSGAQPGACKLSLNTRYYVNVKANSPVPAISFDLVFR